MELHLKLVGILLIGLSLIHLGFPKYFKWKEDLKDLELINRQMMIIHTFFIALFVFLNGLLCLMAARELIETELGRIISLGLAVFWSIRLLTQFLAYSPDLWRGKKFETGMHILFTCFWIYISAVFWISFY